ncbi:hypothetical protein D3C80_1295580 [compost metagenome]
MLCSHRFGKAPALLQETARAHELIESLVAELYSPWPLVHPKQSSSSQRLNFRVMIFDLGKGEPQNFTVRHQLGQMA